MEHSCFPGPYPSSCATLVCVPTNQPPHARGRTGSHGAHNCESTEHQLHPATLQSDTTSDHQHHETPAIFFAKREAQKWGPGPPKKSSDSHCFTFAWGVKSPNHKSPEKNAPKKRKIAIFPTLSPKLSPQKKPGSRTIKRQRMRQACRFFAARTAKCRSSCATRSLAAAERWDTIFCTWWAGRWLVGRLITSHAGDSPQDAGSTKLQITLKRA